MATLPRSVPVVRSHLRDLGSELSRLFPLLLQLGLVLLLIQQYQLESRTFFQVAALAFAGFAVHAVLPLAYRLHFFVFLSLVSVGVALGALDGAWLLFMGLVLIAVARLPVRFALRAGLLIGIGAVLAMARTQLVQAPWSAAVWPILASMFMFRLALYLHAMRHDSAPPSFGQSLAYFFMLPNVCFPLFPVVDCGTFRRNYYDRDPYAIYERGVQWIVRGALHLLLYRFVYLNLTSDPAELQDLGDLVQFVLTTFLLYLRVSGQFHLIVGMLHLFGFALPETHRLYFLASSFTDFWRRINIYWKDFMMKLVYYPSFFRLRRWGDTAALTGATLIVFLVTWILHSYQWFWLRGGFPVTAQDGLFWGVLGAVVVVNARRESRRGRKRTLGTGSTWDAGRAVRTTAMFWTMAVLWSLWSAESMGGWLSMWSSAARVDGVGLALITAVTAGFLFAGGRNWDSPPAASGTGSPVVWYRQPALHGSLTVLLLLLLAQPAVSDRLVGPRLSPLVLSLRTPTLNTRDAELQHKGYYERLDNVGRLSAELWQLNSGKPEGWTSFYSSAAHRQRNDFLRSDIHPNTSIVFNGAQLTTNRWGMRDRDYTMEKSPGTFRVALLGPSHVMGFGVADDGTIDALLEKRLNADKPWDAAEFEVLNFGVGGYSLVQQLALLDDRVLDFRPDVVVITMPPPPLLDRAITGHLTDVVRNAIAIPYAGLDSIVARAEIDALARKGVPVSSASLRELITRLGIPASMPRSEAEERLHAHSPEIVDWVLEQIALRCRETGSVPAVLTLDNVVARPGSAEYALEPAQKHGFLLMDMLQLFEGHDLAALRVADWDNHPNAQANRMVADRIYEEIREQGLRQRFGRADGQPAAMAGI